jgi:L-amino acid N-acyltransferase YncA/predicted GNAT family N-acyltransferase
VIKIYRTHSSNTNFKTLIAQLDTELHENYGDLQDNYNKYNKIESCNTVIIAKRKDKPIACACFIKFNDINAEIKRMFVNKDFRGQGISKKILEGLEIWALECGYKYTILETGNMQKEAIGLYTKSGYQLTENYGPYKGIDTSICMKKKLSDNSRNIKLKMNLTLIDLQEKDFGAIKAINDHYILNSTATFHTDKISIEELKNIIPISHPKYKSYLINYNGKICGYCYLSQYKNRQAYDRTAEITIYLNPDYFGKGIGKATMKKLETIARNHDISVLIGVIIGDNLASIQLFEKCGFEKCAHYRKVGQKFNKILDVVAYQKIIND